MAAYFIVSYDIKDPVGYEGYVPAVLPLLEKHGAEVLVADYDARTLEGEGRGVNVVIKFETEEKAMAFYDDPEYAPVKDIRLRSSVNGTAVLANEFTPAS